VALLLLAGGLAALAAALLRRPHAARRCFASPATRGAGGRRGLARTGRAAKPSPASTIQGDEFKAARDKIRRIQLGLGPNDPLPSDGDEDEEEVEEPVVVPEGKAKGDLSLADADADAAPVKAAITGDVAVTDAKAKKTVDDEDYVQIDPFALKAEDIEELQPEKTEKKEDEGKPNFFQALVSDFAIINWPSNNEVVATFGVVILLVVLYTGFVALVDFGSQVALSSVFEDFYQAMKGTDAE